MKTADHELPFEPSRQVIVGPADLPQRALDDIDRFHPPKQSRIRFGDLKRDLSTLPWIGSQAQRLLQLHARRLTSRARLRPGRLAENHDALPMRRRL